MQESLAEAVDCGDCYVKGEDFEDEVFHAKNLLLGVCVVSDVDKLSDLRGVDLLEFTVTREET